MDNKLKKLIKQSIEKGIPLETFRKTLEEFNWDSYSIEQASREFEIRKFIFDARKNNISDKKIRENLRKHNWTDREISKAMDKIYIPKPSKELLIKNFIILIVLIILILVGMQLLNLTKNSLTRINHYNSLDNEFNQTLYDTNIKSYSQVISKSCGSKKSFIVGKIITDEDISDINISSNIGSLKINSLNSSGEFILEINCEGNVILNFEKENFVPLHKKINLLEGTNFLDIYLIRENEFIQVEDSLEIENIKMNFEENSFGEKDALISLTPFSSTNIEDSYYFPGDLNGLDINGNQIYLESYGFFKIKAEDSSKNKIDLVSNKTIQGSLKIEDSQKKTSPKRIGVWNFDEKLGTWKYVGESKKRCEDYCYYDFNLTKIGSYYALGNSVETTTINLDSYDYVAPSSRRNSVDFAISPPPIPPKKPTIVLREGESVRDLDKIRTDIVCERDNVSGYDRVETTEYYESFIASFRDYSRTIRKYYGRGVSQVISKEGEEDRDIETDCICTVTETDWNSFLYGCNRNYIDENGNSRDLCVDIKTQLSCEKAEVEESCVNDSDYLENLIYNIWLDAYRDAIIKYSKEFNVDPKLVAAIALVELNNNFGGIYGKVTGGDRGGSFLGNLKRGIENPNVNLNNFQKRLENSISSPNSNLKFGNMHFPEELDAIIFGNFETNTNHFKDFRNLNAIKDYNYVLVNSQGFNEIISGENYGYFADSYRISNKPVQEALDNQVLVLTAYVATQDILWITNPNGGNKKLSDYGVDIFGHLYNIGWKYFDPKENPRAVKMKESSFPTVVDGKDYPNTMSFGERTKLFYNSKKLDYFLSDEWNFKKFQTKLCNNNKESDLSTEQLKLLNQFDSFRDFSTNFISNNLIIGNTILDPPKDKDISILEGVDVISGKIHLPINDFVYYSEIPSFKEKLQGDLVIYDSFITDNKGEYSIADKSGVFRLVENNTLVKKEGSTIIIGNEFEKHEFGEKIGNNYFITKKKYLLGDKTSEINYFYESGKLKKINFEDEEVIFNYNGNRLESLEYNYPGDSILEKFIYENNQLSRTYLEIKNESFLETNFSKIGNIFSLSSDNFIKNFTIDKNKVKKLSIESLENNSLKEIIEFKYNKDYTSVKSNNETINCYKGICFIDEITNLLTTSSQCIDSSKEFYSEDKDFDRFVLRILGRDSAGGYISEEIAFSKKDFGKNLSLKVPTNSNLSLFLELNGVPSIPINFETKNKKSINLSSLIKSPKSCSNSRISFGGFSPDSCIIYKNDKSRLNGCLIGSRAMFNSRFEYLSTLLESSKFSIDRIEEHLNYLRKSFERVPWKE